MSPVDFFWPTIPLKADRCHDEKKPCSAVSQKAFINDLTKREYTIQDFRKRVKKSRDAVTLISIHIRQALTRKLWMCTIFQKSFFTFGPVGLNYTNTLMVLLIIGPFGSRSILPDLDPVEYLSFLTGLSPVGSALYLPVLDPGGSAVILPVLDPIGSESFCLFWIWSDSNNFCRFLIRQNR